MKVWKPPGFVLQRAQLEQMVDAIGIVLNVAVEHGRIGLETQLVGRARGFEPLLAVNLVVANDGADAGGKDLRAAAGHGVDACLAKLDQGLVYAELGAPSEECNLDHGEGLDVHLRKTLFEAANEIEEEFEGQVGVQTADDVKLRDGLRIARGGCFPGLVECHGVAGGVTFLAAKGAELAGSHADVGRVDMAIDVEVGEVAVHPLTDMVGQPAHRQNVRRGIKRKPIFGVQTLLGQHLGGDRLQARIVSPKGMGRTG